MEREESSINYTLAKHVIGNLTIDDEYIYKYSTPRLSGNIAVFSPDACFDLVNITGNIDYENNPDIDNVFCIGGRRAWLWVTDTEKEREYNFPQCFVTFSLELELDEIGINQSLERVHN